MLHTEKREGLVSEVICVMYMYYVERPTGELGASKVTKIQSILVANDQEVLFKCLLSSVV